MVFTEPDGTEMRKTADFPQTCGGVHGTGMEPREKSRVADVDDRYDLPAVDRHDGHQRGRYEPWPWMMGTSFPAVDRHGTTFSDTGRRHGQHSATCEPRGPRHVARAIATPYPIMTLQITQFHNRYNRHNQNGGKTA